LNSVQHRLSHRSANDARFSLRQLQSSLPSVWNFCTRE